MRSGNPSHLMPNCEEWKWQIFTVTTLSILHKHRAFQAFHVLVLAVKVVGASTYSKKRATFPFLLGLHLYKREKKTETVFCFLGPHHDRIYNETVGSGLRTGSMFLISFVLYFVWMPSTSYFIHREFFLRSVG